MKNANVKKLVSFGAIILGAIMVIYALSAMRRISNAKGTISNFGRVSDSSTSRFMTGSLNSEASRYDTKVMVLLVAGIIFVVAGCAGAYHYKKHYRKH